MFQAQTNQIILWAFHGFSFVTDRLYKETSSDGLTSWAWNASCNMVYPILAVMLLSQQDTAGGMVQYNFQFGVHYKIVATKFGV